MIDVIRFEVLGTPAPKGSSRAMLRGGKAVNVPSGSGANKEALADWNSAVRAASMMAIRDLDARDLPLPFINLALRLRIRFRLRRPKSHYGTGKRAGQLRDDAPSFVSTKPDLSKIVRATEDSMIGIVFDDDARIAQVILEKVYANPGGPGEGATIEVSRAR